MKLAALFLLLVLIGLSGAACWSCFREIVNAAADGLQFGLWMLLAGHLIAACVMVCAFFDTK